MLKIAKDNGMSNEGHQRLTNIVEGDKGIFRIRLGIDEPARVEPMKVQLETNSRPVIAKAQRFSESQRNFLDTYTNTLIEFGFIVEEKNPTWAAAQLLVPKPAPANFRMTLDLRPINAATIPIGWPMPHIDSELLDLAGSKCYASIGSVSGYLKFPLDKDSQAYHSFITQKGVFRPTRTL